MPIQKREKERDEANNTAARKCDYSKDTNEREKKGENNQGLV